MDANDAGGRYSEDCTLILTEGDSAKSLVVGGLSVAGRDKYGVFPLRSASQTFCHLSIHLHQNVVFYNAIKSHTKFASLVLQHIACLKIAASLT